LLYIDEFSTLAHCQCAHNIEVLLECDLGRLNTATVPREFEFTGSGGHIQN